MQVVGAHSTQFNYPGGLTYFRAQRHSLKQMLTGERVRTTQPFRIALVDDLPATGTRGWTEINDMIGDSHHFRFVFHDENRVPLVPQGQQQIVQPTDVMRM